MEIKICDKKKKELFIGIFQALKAPSSMCNVQILQDRFHIQGMDKSHICLFELNLHSTWFDKYTVDAPQNICFHISSFCAMISAKSEDQSLAIKFKDQDNLMIEFENISTNKNGDYHKYYVLPLMDYDYEEMQIPETEYDAEFTIQSKQITEMLYQLANFGDNICITCTDTHVDFKATGPTGEMRANTSVDNMVSYAIVEDEEIKLIYSLPYINKMCVTNKLTEHIEFSLSNDRPMKIGYQLGLGSDSTHTNSLIFYIAPKIDDE